MSDLPRKAVARTARLAALPLGFAGRSAVGMGRRLGGASAEAVMTDVQQRTAEQLFRTLGELKGGAMKLGQTLSVLESALPEELTAPYREQLIRLQDSAPPMSATTVHHVLATELGTKWRHQLVELDDDPAAAASIGQVHRGPLGRRPRGRRQGAVPRRRRRADVRPPPDRPGGPDVRRDAARASTSSRWSPSCRPGSPRSSTTGSRPRRSRRSPTSSATTRDFVVPAVVAHSEKVLVSEWVETTASLARLIAEGTQEERNHYGDLYVRFLFEGPARVGMLHADPHPGNFRMLPTDGRHAGRHSASSTTARSRGSRRGACRARSGH